MSESKHGTKLYLRIGIALLIFTVITVLVSYIHFPLALTITLALLIATFKASLVACYFMHLIDEKKLIYVVMVLTVIGFFACLLIPMLSEMSPYGSGWTIQ